MALYLTRSLALAVCEQIEAAYKDKEQSDRVPAVFTAHLLTKGLTGAFFKAVVDEAGSSIAQLKDAGVITKDQTTQGPCYEVDMRKLRQLAGLPVARGSRFL